MKSHNSTIKFKKNYKQKTRIKKYAILEKREKTFQTNRAKNGNKIENKIEKGLN